MTDPQQTADEAPWAAQRDASWYNRPNVRSTKVIHVAGRICPYGYMSRCGRSVLTEDLTWPLDAIPARLRSLRCQSNGCRQAWEAADQPEAVQ